VLIAYCIQNRTDQYYETLESGLDIIREMAAVGDSAKSEVSLIEALEQALKRLQLLSTGVRKGQKSGKGSTPIGYDSFTQWMRTATSKSHPGTDALNVAQDNPPVPVPIPGSRPTEAGYINWLPTEASSSTTNQGTTFGANDGDVIGLDSLQSAAGSAFFGMEDFVPVSDGYTNPERQLLENFLAIPEYEFPFATGITGAQSSGSFPLMGQFNEGVFNFRNETNN
jgi:hypothetical protein